MRDKPIMMIVESVLLCMIVFGGVSCKKKESDVNKQVDDSSQLKPDVAMLAMEGRKLSNEEVRKFEDKLATSPDDLVLRTKLLGWYFGKQFHSEPARKARQKHVLWFILNHPDAEVTGTPEVMLDPMLDKEVYYEAKKLWLEQVDAHDKNTAVIGNAAHFFLIHERNIAEELLKKAQAIEPENSQWTQLLGRLYMLEASQQSAKQKTETSKKSLEQFEKTLSSATSELDEFYQLAEVAKIAFDAGEIKKAETYADKLLSLAPRYRNNWNYGNAVHHGNLILGRLALISGDLDSAKKYLIEAGKTPGSPQLNSFGPNMALAKELLEKNEREAVLQYFRLCGLFWKMGQDKLEDWAAIIKAGRTPDFTMNLNY